MINTLVKILLALALSVTTATLRAQHNVVPATDEFHISGSVKNELHITIRSLLQFKQEDLGNVVLKNKRGEEKGTAKNMKGVLLKTILDSAHISVDKPKEYSQLCISLIASDGFKNVYSWNEVFNTEVGNHIYIITEMDGKPIDQMPDRILVMSLSDINSGSRHLKGLARIDLKKIK